MHTAYRFNRSRDTLLVLFALLSCAQFSSAQPEFNQTLEVKPFNKNLSKMLEQSYAPVVSALELMDQFNVDKKLDQAIARLRKDNRALPYLSQLYKKLDTLPANKYDDKGVNTGYTRWKIVNLMGLLDNRDAIKHLDAIAQTPLPNPELAGDVAYANEYRIRLRSLASLERLKAVEPLTRIYEKGGPLSRAAAVNLFEMGVKVDGVKRIDGEKVIGLGDPKNFNLKKQDKLKVKDSPRPIRDSEEKITPRPTSKEKFKQSSATGDQ